MIRSVPSNPEDTDICGHMAYSVVHGLMAGFTGFTVGNVNNKCAYIPFEEIARKGSSIVTRNDRRYQRMLAKTGQPSFINNPIELVNEEMKNLCKNKSKISISDSLEMGIDLKDDIPRFLESPL